MFPDFSRFTLSSSCKSHMINYAKNVSQGNHSISDKFLEQKFYFVRYVQYVSKILTKTFYRLYAIFLLCSGHDAKTDGERKPGPRTCNMMQISW